MPRTRRVRKLTKRQIAEMARPIPPEVRHDWTPNPPRGDTAYVCKTCNKWTANLPLYLDEVCPVKERRKEVLPVEHDRRRYDDRRGDDDE